MYLMLILIGILFLTYFLCIAFFVGHGTNFYFIWFFLGTASILFGVLLKRGYWQAHVSPLTRKILLLAFCLGLILFLIVEACIVSGFSQKGKAGADYVIVLGAQMKKNGPSKALQYRLDETIKYLSENPDAKVIVSGGKGPDEHISEAQGMYDYLVAAGVDEDKTIKEDASRNTVQNLKFSAEYLDKEKDSVAVVTNDFHIFRAVNIARKAGYRDVCGIAAKGEPFLQWNNMMREFFGVVKDFLFGNM